MYLVGLNNIILFPTKAELKAPVTDKLIAAIDDARRDRARAEFTGTSEFKVISDKSDASHQELETHMLRNQSCVYAPMYPARHDAMKKST